MREETLSQQQFIRLVHLHELPTCGTFSWSLAPEVRPIRRHFPPRSSFFRLFAHRTRTAGRLRRWFRGKRFCCAVVARLCNDLLLNTKSVDALWVAKSFVWPSVCCVRREKKTKTFLLVFDETKWAQTEKQPRTWLFIHDCWLWLSALIDLALVLLGYWQQFFFTHLFQRFAALCLKMAAPLFILHCPEQLKWIVFLTFLSFFFFRCFTFEKKYSKQ